MQSKNLRWRSSRGVSWYVIHLSSSQFCFLISLSNPYLSVPSSSQHPSSSKHRLISCYSLALPKVRGSNVKVMKIHLLPAQRRGEEGQEKRSRSTLQTTTDDICERSVWGIVHYILSNLVATAFYLLEAFGDTDTINVRSILGHAECYDAIVASFRNYPIWNGKILSVSHPMTWAYCSATFIVLPCLHPSHLHNRALEFRTMY